MASSDLSLPTRPRSGGTASALVALAFAVLALLLGRGALLLHGLVNWDGLAAVSAAFSSDSASHLIRAKSQAGSGP